MARKVYISSDMSVDEKLIEVAEVNSQYALLWPWILTAFDDWGRAEANAKRLKAQIFPMFECITVQMIDEALTLFSKSGLIVLYSIKNKVYMSVPHDKWFKYQTHIRKEKREKDESRFPAPNNEDSTYSAHLRASARDSAEISENTRICIPSPSLSLSPSLSKDVSSKKDAVNKILASHFPYGVKETVRHDIVQFMDNGLELELLNVAYQLSVKNDSPSKPNFIKSTLQNFLNDGITTVVQYEAREAQHQTAAGGESNAKYPRYNNEIHAASTRTRSITGGKVGRV